MIFCLNLAFVPWAYALDGPVNRLQSPEAKNQTVQAIQAMEEGRWTVAQQKIAQSKDPLASKIYHWRLFMKTDRDKWDSGFFLRLSHFIRQNSDWPGIETLMRQAEKSMPDDLPSREALVWFKTYPPETMEGMSRYMDALIIEGRRDEARKVLADWWAEILVSRDIQRKIFQKYGQYLTVSAHKKRLDALLLAGHYANARAIAGVLGQGYPELAEARIALAEDRSAGLTGLINKVPSYLQNDPGLLYERLKWRRKHNLDFGAIEILHLQPDPANVRNPEDWWKERHIIIRRLLEQKKCKSAYYLAEKHFQKEGFSYAQAEWLTGWLALRCMEMPTEAYERFIALHQKVETPVSKARAAYWAGRAAKDLKQEDLATSWYKKASQYQTVYYGQLARHELSLEERLPKVSVPSLSRRDVEDFKKKELIQAAHLYAAAGLKRTASDFIFAFVDSENSPKAYRFGAETAAKMGYYHDAVKIAKNATKKGLFLTAQAFPTLIDVDGRRGVEPALVYALIRQESMFDHEAKSSAGARGLMQLMPATAAETAKKEKISYNPEWLTQRPDYNIHLGSSYLRRLLVRYDDSYALAVAAYNAGPGRVDQWIKLFGDPRTGQINMLDWIELIPVYETRNYVQRVMENLYVYRVLLKDKNDYKKQDIHMVKNINP